MTDEKSDRPGVIAPPPLIFAAGLVTGFLIQRVFPIPLLPGAPAPAMGVSLIGAVIILAAWAFRTMLRAGTHVDPYKPTTRLVSDGPFRFTRNPLYLSLTLIYLGVALLFNALWPILLLPFVLLVLRRGVIDREERYLERKFGEEYIRYKNRVRRWI
jgi:protein-S-isoprenylcysteine O-methyltransferase Ste14